MAEDSTFNGWTNYPTWAVNLWLSNDEGLYHETLSRTEALLSTNSDHPRVDVADNLRSWVVDDLSPDLGASFSADLLGYALDQVNWNEIADSWIEDLANVSAEVDC